MASVAVPESHKAVVYDKPGELSVKQDNIKTPEPGPGEVLIRLTHSGVCHSDMSVMLNAWSFLPAPTAQGQVGGHEGVGEVVKLGTGADANCKIGDRVGIKWLASACGGCNACLAGYDASCANMKISGYYTPGTFQQYAIGPAAYVTPIPKGLESAAAAPMLCGGVTTYSAIRKCGARPGQRIAVLGAGGGLGHIATQLAGRGFGLRVIGVDHSSKKDLVLSSGAEDFVAIDQVSDGPAEVQKITNGLGVKAVLVLTASQKAYDTAIGMLSVGGTLMAVGVPDRTVAPIAQAAPQTLVAKELSIKGIAVGDRQDAIECLDMAARGVVKMHYTTEKMENLKSVFEKMDKGELLGRVVLDLQD
ncbi:MAG: hypothetical protein Q9162_007368 [Coniocarpon cinnabarinum]